jgi:hypothetical protein
MTALKENFGNAVSDGCFEFEMPGEKGADGELDVGVEECSWNWMQIRASARVKTRCAIREPRKNLSRDEQTTSASLFDGFTS